MRRRGSLRGLLAGAVCAALGWTGACGEGPAPPEAGELGNARAAESSAPEAAQGSDSHARLETLGYGGATGPEPSGPHTVRGVVRDRAGRPVAGVDVNLKMAINDAPRVVRQVRTDARGRYAIGELPPGQVWVGLEEPVNLREPWALVTELSGDVQHDFTLAGELRLSGSVTAPQGGEVVLRLYRTGSGTPEGTVVLAGSGRFVFGGLLPGPYRLRVDGERHGSVEREVSILETTTGLTVDLAPAIRLSGRFEPEYAYEAKLLRYELRCAQSGYSDASWFDVGERFEWTHLAPGSYELRVRHPPREEKRDRAHLGAYRIDVRASESDLRLPIAAGHVLALEPRADALRVSSEGQVVLETPAGVELTRGSFGQVAALADGRARFREHLRDPYFGMQYLDVERIELKLVPDGRYRLRARFEGYRDVDRDVTVDGDTQLDLALQAVPGRMVALESPEDYLRMDARPAGSDAEWITRLEWDARSKAAHTVALGSKQCFLESGTYDLRLVCARRVGVVMAAVSIEDSEQTLVLTPQFQPGLALRGELEDSLGRPLAVHVHLLRREGLEWVHLPEHSQRSARSAGASFEFQGLAPGAYRIALDREGRNALEDVRLEDRDLALKLSY